VDDLRRTTSSEEDLARLLPNKEAFSVGVDSQEAFIEHLRRPVTKTKHRVALAKAKVGGVFRMYLLGQSPPTHKIKVTLWLLLFGILIIFDLILLQDILTEIIMSDFSGGGLEEVVEILVVIVLGLPLFSPFFALFGAFTKDLEMLKEMALWNSYSAVLYVPMILGLCSWRNKDP